MDIAAKLDDHGKFAWIGVMVLGFILFWPIGLGILAYLIWSGRMGCWKHRRWRHEGMERMQDAARKWWHDERPAMSSGNHAFDEYRTETLRRLEDEQREFKEFLERLRFARDRSEFDQFMAERRNRTSPTTNPPPQS